MDAHFDFKAARELADALGGPELPRRIQGDVRDRATEDYGRRLGCLELAVQLMGRSTTYGSGRGRAEETTDAADYLLAWLENDS